MTLVNATEVRKGSAIQIDGRLCIVTEYQHITPGNWRGYVQLRVRDVIDGKSYERRLRAADKVENVYIDRKELQYLYSEQGQTEYFMDTTTYEQYPFNRAALGNDFLYLVPNCNVTGEFYNGNLVNVNLPSTVELTVTETEPGLKGATVTNVQKPATVETGLKVRVPPFISQGEKIRIDTRTGEYLERAKG
jgi:elongation factor P